MLRHGHVFGQAWPSDPSQPPQPLLPLAAPSWQGPQLLSPPLGMAQALCRESEGTSLSSLDHRFIQDQMVLPTQFSLGHAPDQFFFSFWSWVGGFVHSSMIDSSGQL